MDVVSTTEATAAPASDPMVTDNDKGDDDAEENQETQETQQTQPTSQDPDDSDDITSSQEKKLWGFLQPCNPQSPFGKIIFWKGASIYKIGRHDTSHIVFHGFKISNHHATIQWDGKETKDSCVILRDISTNGTFVNGHKIGKGSHRILREGNEVAFGTLQSPKPDEDYRFIFRHLASGTPTEGLHAQYDVSSELGKGSFATVLRAIHRKTGEWVAIKMIQESRRTGREPGSTPDAAGNAQKTTIGREIDIMQSLKHPNICELKDVFYMDNNDISLVLELVDGGDLLEYILTRGGLSEDVSKHITYQLCLALSYVHKQGVAHRDLKPENVLLTKDDPPTVKVADFGLAKATDSLTMLRTMCGTPAYLAPEVVRQENHEGYDNLVDSWSVGVIVFSMLTNSNPFIEDDTQRDIRTRIAERTIEWDTIRRAEVTPECESFLRCLLDYDPTKRMSMRDALKHPWLASYVPVLNASQSSAHGRSDGNELAADVSMVDGALSRQSESISHSVSQDFEKMRLGPGQTGLGVSVGAGEAAGVAGPSSTSQQSNGSSIPGLAKTPPREERRALGREASRMLQRRVHVLDEAEEAGVNVPEPSPEMIINATREENRRRQGMTNGNDDSRGHGEGEDGNSKSNSKGKGKRLRNEVSSSLSDLEDDGSGEASPDSENGKDMDRDVVMEGTPAKKGRMAPGSSDGAPSGQRRGRGGAVGGRGRGKAKLPENANKDGAPLRRSGRNAGKNAN